MTDDLLFNAPVISFPHMFYLWRGGSKHHVGSEMLPPDKCAIHCCSLGFFGHALIMLWAVLQVMEQIANICS